MTSTNETMEEMAKALSILVECNWQIMNGDEVLDIDPEKWMRDRLIETAQGAIEEHDKKRMGKEWVGSTRDNIIEFLKKYPSQAMNALDSAYLAGLDVAERAIDEDRERLRGRIGFLRQWLNEDRIGEGKNMVTNEEIEHWLAPKSK